MERVRSGKRAERRRILHIPWGPAILHQRRGRALAAISFLSSIYDPRAERSDILQVLDIIAEFAEISVEKAAELIKPGEKDETGFERLPTLRKSPEKP